MNRNNASSHLKNETSWFPARVDADQAAKLLGFQSHDIPILIGEELLTPLGKPAANARKYFARVKIEEFAFDVNWLSKATRALYMHWQKRKGSRSQNDGDDQQSLAA